MSRSFKLWQILQELQKNSRFIDLTHGFEPGIPHAPDFPEEQRSVLYDHPTDGFMAHRYDHVGQWGTHVDPPIHFAAGGRTLDQIEVNEMILPLVIFDVSREVATNSDYTLKIEDIEQWEERNGEIPPKAFAALRTDWSKRWPDAVKIKNADVNGVSHTPGWSLEALRFLCERKGIAACGHETADTDGGIVVDKDEFPCETYVLEQDKYQIELMTNLDQLPEAGSIVIASFPKPIGGSGFPARVFALAPK